MHSEEWSSLFFLTSASVLVNLKHEALAGHFRSLVICGLAGSRWNSTGFMSW
jgi:hypothetical protein